MTKWNEIQYVHLLEDILENGIFKDDRTGVGTQSIFGHMLRLDVSESMPVITIRKLNYLNGIKEFIFMINGHTNTKLLEEQGVNIWKDNTTRDFLDKRGLTDYLEGEMGQIYGYNMRNFNGDWYAKQMLNRNTGVDQFSNLIKDLRSDPNSRRLVMTTHNPSTVRQSVLYSCHGVWIQFYVQDDKLSMSMTQRSIDTILGLPTNMVYYTCMLHTVAKLVDKKPHQLIMMLNDCHIYKNHFEKVERMLTREVLTPPKFELTKDFTDIIQDFEKTGIIDLSSLTPEDFNVTNYESHSGLKFPMAV